MIRLSGSISSTKRSWLVEESFQSAGLKIWGHFNYTYNKKPFCKASRCITGYRVLICKRKKTDKEKSFTRYSWLEASIILRSSLLATLVSRDANFLFARALCTLLFRQSTCLFSTAVTSAAYCRQMSNTNDAARKIGHI